MRDHLSTKDLKQALGANINEARTSFLSKADQKNACNVLADAFANDPMMVWMAGLDENDPQSKNKMRKLCLYMHSWINNALISGRRGSAVGVIGLNNELVGCMTVAPSSCHKETMLDMCFNMIKLGSPPMYKSKTDYCTNSIQRMEKLNLLEKKRINHMKDTNRWIYLQCIGIGSTQQGHGYGKSLLTLLLRTADSLKVPTYLETESDTNESLYKHFGFCTLEKVDVCVPGDESSNAHLTMYLMRRDL